MDKRLRRILGLLVEDVIETGEPVGSQYLVETYRLTVSPATIRNWFAELEDQGYIAHQHTSSGRVPTEKGYRLYIEELLHDAQPSIHGRLTQNLRVAFRVPGDTTHKLKSLARAAADMAEAAVVVGVHESETFYTGLSYVFSQPEFHDWNRIVTLTEFLERLDDVLQDVSLVTNDRPTTMIGRACPFGRSCGLMLAACPEQSYIGLLGPMRMNYRKGLTLLRAIQEVVAA